MEVRVSIPDVERREEGRHNEAMTLPSCSRSLFLHFLLKTAKTAERDLPNKTPPLNTVEGQKAGYGHPEGVYPGVEKEQKCHKHR